MIVFRHADPRYPFLWEDASQPAGRWHGPGEGPVQYFADTPTGAWAEFVRHEEIRDPAELEGVRRALWAVELDNPPEDNPRLSLRALTGGMETYPGCQEEALRLRSQGCLGIRARSAALLPGSARGWRVDRGVRPGPRRNGLVFALFGPQPSLIGWAVVTAGSPPPEVLDCVRYF